MIENHGVSSGGNKLIRIKDLPSTSDTARRKANPALGKWVSAERKGDSYVITETSIKHVTSNGTYSCSYSLSAEGYLITDDDVFVLKSGALRHYYSNTEAYIISTYVRAAGF